MGSSATMDRLGMFASAACVVHCILTPIVLSMSSVAAHFLPGEEKVHRVLAVVIALIGAVALQRGYRKHRRGLVGCLMAVGIALITFAALYGDRLPSHWAEVGVTFLGSGFMIGSHFLNHTFCRSCECAPCETDRG